MATDGRPDNIVTAIGEVADRTTVIVREEIALAKAEMTEKITRLIRGVVVGIAAGIFAVAGLIYLLHALSWLIWKLIGGRDNFYIGFLIVAAALFILGGLAGFVAARSLRKGTPPTPAMAIEEAQLIRQTLTSPHPGTPQGTPGGLQAPDTSRAEVGAR